MSRNNSLTASDKMVWFALTLLVPNQDVQPIKRKHIANVAGVSVRTVSSSLKRLDAKGIVSLQRPHSGIYYTYSLHRDIDDSLLAFLRPF